MSEHQDLPESLLLHIINRGNLFEMQALCNASRSFRQQCNKIAETLIHEKYKDFTHLYGDLLLLGKFTITFVNCTGSVKIKHCRKNDILTVVTELLSNILVDNMTDIGITYDNMQKPNTVVLDFQNSSCEQNFILILQGQFSDYKETESLVNDINEVVRK